MKVKLHSVVSVTVNTDTKEHEYTYTLAEFMSIPIVVDVLKLRHPDWTSMTIIIMPNRAVPREG